MILKPGDPVSNSKAVFMKIKYGNGGRRNHWNSAELFESLKHMTFFLQKKHIAMQHFAI
jgi:hypothetical protein